MASETNLVMFYIAVILAVITDLTSGHVSLTFPPARKYGLDFLDNVRYVIFVIFFCNSIVIC
jgi:hypothetical protein